MLNTTSFTLGQETTDTPPDAVIDETTPPPTDVPTEIPTLEPPVEPTLAPTDVPTEPPTDLPAPTSTELPTEAATETPSDVPLPTDVPTEEPVATAEVTPEPTIAFTPSPTPTEPASDLPPEPVLSLLFEETFDSGASLYWTLPAGWSFVPTDAGQAVQSAPAASAASSVTDQIADAAIAARVRTDSAVRLSARVNGAIDYSATLNQDGLVTLWKADTALAAGSTADADGSAWRVLRLSVMDNVLRVSVDGVEVIAVEDSEPLPPGRLGFSSDDTNGTITVDAVQVFVPSEDVARYALPTPTPVMGQVFAAGQPITLNGILSLNVGDPPIGSGLPDRTLVALTDDEGTTYELRLSAVTARTLHGKRVEVRGRVSSPGTASAFSQDGTQASQTSDDAPVIDVDSIQRVSESESSDGDTPAAAQALPVSGSQSWVSVLCRFSDVATMPRSPAWYQTLMTGASTAPHLDHYWREISYSAANLTGSAVVGWVTLPHPRSFYVTGSGNNAVADLDSLAVDCTKAAESSVYFPDYAGINMMFNDDLDCCAWGGGQAMTLNGQSKFYRLTWLPIWANTDQSVIAHEMGHGFGLPHSSGPYGQVYDSYWDVMSRGGTCSPVDSDYSCIAVGTIAYHLDELGWIPAPRIYTASLSGSETITLERLNQPQPNGNYLMAQIPIGGSATEFYTVEARRWNGYDVRVPLEGVLINHVDLFRSAPAQIVDENDDQNNNVNDASAIWTVNETFTDAANGISIDVTAMSASGYTITIDTGSTCDYSVGAGDTAGLIAAITSANGNGDEDVICLAHNSTYMLTSVHNTLNGANGLPVISTHVTILGMNTAIARNSSAPAFRIFDVSASGNLSLEGVIVQGGLADGNGAGGGIYNAGTLSANSVDILGNAAYQGGGLYSSGTVTFGVVGLVYNSAQTQGGGAYIADGLLTVDDSVIQGNDAANGGGISIEAGASGDADNVYLLDNTASENGGALEVRGSMLASGVQIDGNHALTEFGGAVANWGMTTITTSIVTGNSAASGGALYTGTGGGALSVTSSCIVGNSSVSVLNAGGATINATSNWWGAATGPSGTASGRGDSISSGVTFSPFQSAALYTCGTLASNDDFEDEKVIASVPFTDSVSTGSATNGAEDVQPETCDTDVDIQKTIWYRYTPTSGGSLRILTAGSDFDTVVTVWTGLPGSFTLIGCDDDSGGEGTSLLDIPILANTNYHIMVGGYAGDTGNLELSVAKLSNLVPPTGLTSPTTTRSQIALNWTDNSTNESNFRIERATPGGVVAWLQISMQPSNTTSFTDTGLDCGTSYRYRVRVYRGATNEYSLYSNALTAATQPCILSAPTNLTLIGAAESGVTLGWDDNEATETSYRVERSSAVDFGWGQIATIGASLETYTDTAVECGRIYYYRVRAARSTDSEFSAYTTALEVVMPSCVPPSNDSAFTPLQIPSGTSPYTVTVNTTRATDSEYDNWAMSTCDLPVAGLGKSVWFRYTAPVGSLIRIDTFGSDFDTAIRVFDGFDGIGDDALACNDQAAQGVHASQVLVNGTGDPLYIMVGGYGFATGNLVLNVGSALDTVAPPQNLIVTGVNASQMVIEWVDVSSNETSFLIEISGNNEVSWFQKMTVTANETSALVDGMACASGYSFRVRAFKSPGTHSAYSNVATAVTIACPVPTQAVPLMAPANGFVTNNPLPELAWSSCCFAQTYEVVLDTNSSFSSVDYAFTYNSSHFTVEETLADGTYFWRVRAVNSSGRGPWSASRSFTVDTTAPASPVPGSPAHLAKLTTARPVFTWAAAPTAARYRVEVANNPAFDVPVTRTTTALTVTWTTSLVQDTYYWRVIAIDAAGNESAPVVEPSFTVNLLRSPAQGAYLVAGTPTPFQWFASTGAGSYVVELSATSNFAVLLPSTCATTTALTCTVSPALPTGVYYWRLKVGGVAPDVYRTFTITNALPAAPTLVTATNTFTQDTTPELAWQVLSDLTYELQVDNVAAFTSPEYHVQGLTASPAEVTETLANGLYNWRLRAVNADGAPGAWSAVHTFTVDTAAPGVPVLSAPGTNATTVDTTPTFTWGAVTGATAYQLEVYDSMDTLVYFTAADTPISTLTHTLAGTDALSFGAYEWRVRARDRAGNWGSFSTARTFSVTLLRTPANGAFTTDTTPAFTWASAGAGSSYTVVVTGGSGQVFTCTVNTTTCTSTLLAHGTYTWTLSTNQNGSDTIDPVSFTFIVSPTPPVPPSFITPTGFNTSTPSPELNWNTVDAAASYQLQLDDVSTFASPETFTDITSMPYALETTLTVNRTYYWRVRSENALGITGAWSASRTIVFDTAAPGVPNLTAPAINALTSDTTPTFTWAAVAGANAYQLELYDSADTLVYFTEAATPVTSASHTLPGTSARPFGEYAWRVRARDRAGNWGSFSALRAFTITRLRTPANGSSTSDTTPAFTWAAGASGSTYVVTVTGENGTAFTCTKTTLTCTPTAAQLLTPGTYTWTLTVNGTPDPTSFTFVVSPTPPAPPSGLTATGTATSDDTPSFNWNAVNGAVSYQLQIDESATFNSPDLFSEITTMPYELESALPMDGTYSWRVRSVNQYGAAGAWSTTRTIILDRVAPGTASLTTPVPNAVLADNTPAFVWAAVGGANRYRVEVAEDEDFTQIVLTGEVGTAAYTVRNSRALDNGTYYWRVTARDAAGNWGAESLFRRIRIAAP